MPDITNRARICAALKEAMRYTDDAYGNEPADVHELLGELLGRDQVEPVIQVMISTAIEACDITDEIPQATMAAIISITAASLRLGYSLAVLDHAELATLTDGI